MLENLIPALTLTTLAGLSTGIGGAVAALVKKPSERLLSAFLGFSAGIMLTVSLGEMLPHGGEVFVARFGRLLGAALMLGSITVGIMLSMIADRLVPERRGDARDERADLSRLGLVTAVAVCVHNFPEGIATFMSSYSNLSLGVPLALSVALHNIPEGMAVAMPILYGTKSRAKAVGCAFASGLSEPLGAVLAYLFLHPFMNEVSLAGIFGVIVGLMCYIAFDELVPSSLSYSHPGASLTGLLSGILLMSGGILSTA